MKNASMKATAITCAAVAIVCVLLMAATSLKRQTRYISAGDITTFYPDGSTNYFGNATLLVIKDEALAFYHGTDMYTLHNVSARIKITTK